MIDPVKFSLSVCLTVSLPSLANAETPFWMKTWTVSGVESLSNPDPFFDHIAGMHIALEEHKALDPFTRDCVDDLSYSDIQLRPVSEIGEHFGQFWKWPDFATGSVNYGWVRCNGSNVGAFAFPTPDIAYLFFEDGAVIVLH